MKIGSKEHYEMLDSFEKSARLYLRGRFEREDKSQWAKGNFYENGEVNQMFKVFSMGYAAARCIYLQGDDNHA